MLPFNLAEPATERFRALAADVDPPEVVFLPSSWPWHKRAGLCSEHFVSQIHSAPQSEDYMT